MSKRGAVITNRSSYADDDGYAEYHDIVDDVTMSLMLLMLLLNSIVLMVTMLLSLITLLLVKMKTFMIKFLIMTMMSN